jgi:hypothetical protein
MLQPHGVKNAYGPVTGLSEMLIHSDRSERRGTGNG